MLYGDMMRRRTRAQEGFALTNLALAAWLIVSAWLVAIPLAAAWMFTLAGALLLAFSGYNAFLLHQDLPPSRRTAVMVQLVALGVILVPAVQPVGVLAMANAVIVGSVLFALAGVNWTGITPTKAVAARRG